MADGIVVECWISKLWPFISEPVVFLIDFVAFVAVTLIVIGF